MDYPSRQRALQATLARHHLDALLVSYSPNIRYLCGFTGSAGALLVTEKSAVFFTDGRYTIQARSEVCGPRVVIARKAALTAAADWMAPRAKQVAGNTRCRVGVEGQHLSLNAYRQLAATLGSDFRVTSAPPILEEMRAIKDSEEIERIRAAAVLGASLFPQMLKLIGSRVNETEVAAEVEHAARKAGAEGMSFPTIIVSGERSALPHGHPANEAIGSNGFVVCDFGVILTGYCSDRTRTVYVGRPTPEARRVYQVVREAGQAALESVRPGTSVGEVDRAARKVLQKQGLGKYFTHSTGHGVGLEIHEAPRVAAGQTELLQPGMVITIEPGVYLPGKWGVRIEDMVLVTGDGYEVLAPSSTEMIGI
jgi:Xaa-Pro aminopeptidase